MRILVAYYSRTGFTRKAAHAIADTIGAEVEEITDGKDRSGALGYMKGGKDAMMKATTDIAGADRDPSDYDLVIIGTPVWAWNMTPAARTYIKAKRDGFKGVAFFCTYGGSPGKTLEGMEALAGMKPVATLGLTSSEVATGGYGERLKEYVRKIKSSSKT